MASDAMLAHLAALNDATLRYSRDCGRSYVVILAPSQADEPILSSLDGKPVSGGTIPERMIEVVRLERGEEPAR